MAVDTSGNIISTNSQGISSGSTGGTVDLKTGQQTTPTSDQIAALNKQSADSAAAANAGTSPISADSSQASPVPNASSAGTSSQPNYSSIVAGAVPTPTETPATNASKSILDQITQEMQQDTGKAAYAASINAQPGGVNELTAKQNTLTAQLNSLNDQMSALDNASQNVPFAVADQYLGKASTAGQSATTAEAQRNIAVQKAALASQALSLKAQYDMNAGNLENAKANAQQAVDLKYQDLETQIANNTKLLELYKPFMDSEQQQAATARAFQNQQAATALADKKSQQKDLVDKAAASGDSSTMANALKLDPNSPTFAQDLAKVAQDIKLKQPDQWSAPYNQGGMLVQRNLSTGELKSTGIPYTAPSGSGAWSTSDETPPQPGAAGNSIVEGTGRTQNSIWQDAINYSLDKSKNIQSYAGGLSSKTQAQNLKDAISNKSAAILTAAGVDKTILQQQFSANSKAINQQVTYLNSTQRAIQAAEAGGQQVQQAFSETGVNPFDSTWANKTLNDFIKQFGSSGTIRSMQAGVFEVGNEYAQVFARGGMRNEKLNEDAQNLINGNVKLSDLQQVMQELQAQGQIVVNSSIRQVSNISSGGGTDEVVKFLSYIYGATGQNESSQDLNLTKDNTKVNGMIVTLPNGQTWTAPSPEALSQFLKDHGLQ